MRVQATNTKTNTIHSELYYDRLTTREAIKRYRKRLGLKGKHGLVFRISP